MDCSTQHFPVLHNLPEFVQTHVHWVAWCHPTISSSVGSSPPVFSFPQHQGLFQWVSSSHQMAKVLELQHQSFQWIFRIDFLYSDWFDLSAVQGTLKNILQDHSSKASVLWRSAFFMVQLSHLYMATGKTVALTIRTFVSKVMSWLFNTLSSFAIAFLPRSNHLLISWLQPPSAVILELKKIKSVTVSIVSPFICHEVVGLDAMILVFWLLSFKPAFSLFSFTFIKRLFSFSLLSAIRVVSSAYLRFSLGNLSCDPHSQRLSHSQWNRSRCFFGILLLSIIQWMFAIWPLVPLPFLNPACTCEISQFMYCWSLAGRILSFTLLACEMNAVVQ